MTRQFNSRIQCQYCGKYTTIETPMQRWIRNHSRLDSKNGFVCSDLDIILHRFNLMSDLKGEREIEFMMFIEVKTFGAELTKSQRDTLLLFNQVLRNGKENMYSKPKKQMCGQPQRLLSTAKNKTIPLILCGGHLLQLSESDPYNSEWMKWDNQIINTDILVELMLFERDPDKPFSPKRDWMRRRSKPFAKINETQRNLFEDFED